MFRLNPRYIGSMDLFGEVLYRRRADTELSKLSSEVLALDSGSPVGWILMALLCELRKESEKALGFIEKVCIILLL